MLDLREGQWSAAVDTTLAMRLGFSIGDNISIGVLSMDVCAFVVRQPGRSLRADWESAPVLISRGRVDGHWTDSAVHPS